ncbi:MAG: outer membrane lipoprotein-sorting protein [FCB group bacterium]|nr:outer membrane lipoprotein-sorting protein [FCB group bacterium]
MLRIAVIISLSVSLLFGEITGRDIMEKVKAHPTPKSKVSTIKLTIVSVKRGKEKTREREIIRYQKFYSGGKFKSKSLLRFLKPPDVRGIGFLNWNYRNGKDEQWLFLPALGRVKRIAGRDRSGSFMGTDFTYEDLSSRNIDDDDYTLVGEDTLSGLPCYVVAGIPKNKKSIYSKRVAWIDKNNWLIKKIEFYDRKGKLLKVLTIPRHEKKGLYWLVPEMTMENVQTKHRTIMEMSAVKFDTGLKDEYFTERFLMRTD